MALILLIQSIAMRLAAHNPEPDPRPVREEFSQSMTAPVGLHKACPVCHEVFPEHMMSFYGERLLCKPCCHQAEVDAAMPKRQSYRHVSSESIRNLGIALTIVGVLIFLGVRWVPFFILMKKGPKDVVEASRKWAKDPAEKWPTLSMQISPSEGSSIPAGWQLGPNACLVERNDGSIVCVTCVLDRPTLGDALLSPAGKGAKSAANLAVASYDEFARTLSACHLTSAGSNATFTKLLPDARGAFEHGVVVFGEPSGVLPSNWNTFRMRESEYSIGMKMTVLTRDPKTGAPVPLEAMVSSNNLTHDLAALTADQIHRIGRRTGDGSESLFTLSNPYPAEQLIGAPVVDVRGNLAAVITLAFAPTDLDGRTTDFVAFGMHALKSFAGKVTEKK
jgi:hypothetical protein